MAAGSAQRAHGQAGPEDDQPAHLSVRPSAVSMATCVMGMYAVGPEYRPAGHADGRITLPRCPSSVTAITFSVSTGILAVHVPGPAAGISPMLGSAVCRLLLIWFTPVSPVWLREDEDSHHCRRTVAVCDRSSDGVPSRPPPDVDSQPPLLTVKQTARQCFSRPSFMGPQTVVLSVFFFVQQFSVTLLIRVGLKRVPLHHSFRRHLTGRVHAGVWPDQAVRSSSQPYRDMRVSA